MKNSIWILGLAGLLHLFLWSCGSEQSTEVEEEEIVMNSDNEEDGDFSIEINGEKVEVDGIEAAVESLKDEIEKAVQESGEGTDVEVVNFRTLKALLPEKLMGLERTDFEGEKSGGFGITVSKASATYEDDEASFDVEIIDTGGFGFAKIGLAAYTNIEIDRESNDGFERTYDEGGIKFHEKYESDMKTGFIKAFVDERFLVNIEGDGVSEQQLRGSIKQIPLDDLTDMVK